MTDNEDRFLREPEVAKITGLSRTTRWRLEREGRFPRRRRAAPNCVAWLQSEIQEFIRESETVNTREAESTSQPEAA